MQDYVQKLDRPNPFRNGMPGIDWCMMFEKRWSKEISRRVVQNLPKNIAEAGSREVMEDCYNKFQAVYSSFGLDKKPQNNFNRDEIGFQTDAGVQKVLCKRGSRNPKNLSVASQKLRTQSLCVAMLLETSYQCLSTTKDFTCIPLGA